MALFLGSLQQSHAVQPHGRVGDMWVLGNQVLCGCYGNMVASHKSKIAKSVAGIGDLNNTLVRHVLTPAYI